MIYRLLLLLQVVLLTWPPLCAAAEPATALPARANFHLFLLIGQSNMAGRGVITEQDRTPHPRVLVWNQAGAWVPAVDLLHFDKPVAGVGLGKTFGQLLAEADPNITIGLIPCAVGGSPIDAWRPGVYYEPTRSHPWDDALRRARQAMADGELKGILWHQGESDAKPELSASYEEKLHDLIQRLRRELDAPHVPFLVGQMGRFADSPWNGAKEQVDLAHRRLPDRVPQTAFVSSDGLRHQGDKVHFDADSYRELGRRYAAAYRQLVGPP